MSALFAPDTPRKVRRRILTQTRWWPHYVEAVYRGELNRARGDGGPSPSARAEQRAGSALGLAPDRVRRIAGQVRKMRQVDPEYCDYPAMTAEDYLTWERTGEHSSKEEASPVVLQTWIMPRGVV
jgi:hypothetical protein